MKEILSSLDISDWIQIFAILATTFISVISVIIATKSLRLTKQSIEDATKPYLGCYVEMIEVGYFQKYFVIKNFGKTPATIIDIKFDKTVKGLGRNGNIDSIINAIIAPNQKFITAIKVEEKDVITVELTYKDMRNNIFEQSFSLNLGFSSDLLYIERKNTGLSDDVNAIKIIMHQLMKRKM